MEARDSPVSENSGTKKGADFCERTRFVGWMCATTQSPSPVECTTLNTTEWLDFVLHDVYVTMQLLINWSHIPNVDVRSGHLCTVCVDGCGRVTEKPAKAMPADVIVISTTTSTHAPPPPPPWLGNYPYDVRLRLTSLLSSNSILVYSRIQGVALLAGLEDVDINLELLDLGSLQSVTDFAKRFKASDSKVSFVLHMDNEGAPKACLHTLFSRTLLHDAPSSRSVWCYSPC